MVLESTDSFIQKFLIFADLDCCLERAGLQEGLNEKIARKVIREHDQKATWWSQFLFNCSPYNQDLYDTFIRYECQDLVDVVSYAYMVHEEHAQLDFQSCSQAAARATIPQPPSPPYKRNSEDRQQESLPFTGTVVALPFV